MKLIPLLLLLCAVQACGQAPPKPCDKCWHTISDSEIIASSYNNFIVVGNSRAIHPAATRRSDGRWNVYNDTMALEIMYKEMIRLNKVVDSLQGGQSLYIQTEKWQPGTQHLLIIDGRKHPFSTSDNIIIKTHL